MLPSKKSKKFYYLQNIFLICLCFCHHHFKFYLHSRLKLMSKHSMAQKKKKNEISCQMSTMAPYLAKKVSFFKRDEGWCLLFSKYITQQERIFLHGGIIRLAHFWEGFKLWWFKSLHADYYQRTTEFLTTWSKKKPYLEFWDMTFNRII